ncbi:hypothetical protein AAG906_026229 [Vitis piasezkii]
MAPFLGMCNLCMPYWIRDQEGRLVRIENPQDTELDICVNIMDPPQEDQNSQHGQGDNPNAYLSMRDRMHPPRMSAPSCIVPPLEQLIIRPHIVPLLPNFHGMESENPYAHIKEFEEVCNTFREGGASIDLMRLKLFPFTLKDKAKIWLNSLRPRSIRNWDQWVEEKISNFLHKKMRSSMNVGKGIWRPSMLVLIMALIHGSCYVSKVSRGWDEPNSREMGRMKALVNPKGGMYMLSEDMDMKAKVATMARRPNNNAPYGNTYNSSWKNHPNFSWKPRPSPYQPQAQTQAPQQTSLVEQAIVNLSKVMGDFVGEQKAINSQLHQKIENVESSQIKRMDGMQNDLSQKIDNIQYSISRFTNLNTVNEKGKFPSQPSQNPKGVHEVETQDGESSKLREVKAMITLRSGKEVDQPLPKVRQDEELMSRRTLVKESNNQEEKSGKKNASNSSIEEEPRIMIKEDMMKKHMPPLFLKLYMERRNQEFSRNS